MEKFGQIASLLPIKTVIVGSRSDTNIADEIVSLSNGKAIFLAGKTDLKDLIDVMCPAQFVVSNDSGPMHIAATLGSPVFAIFSPTDSIRTGPYGEGHTIIKSDTPCALCFKKSCDDMKCMKSVSVNEGFETITAKRSRRSQLIMLNFPRISQNQ